MLGAQLDVEGREVPAATVGPPTTAPSPAPAPKPACGPAPVPELAGQLGIPLIPEVPCHDPTTTLF